MKRLTVGVLFLTFGVVGGVARADTITITGGQIQSDLDPLALYLTGPGFMMGATSFADPTVGPAYSCYPCAPGATVDMSAVVSGDQLGSGYLGGDLSHSYYFGGSLAFNAGSVTLPSTVSATSYVEASSPFTMAGTLLAFDDPSRTGEPLFRYDLIGSGTAGVDFTANNGAYQTYVWSLDFQPSPATTPEPASVLLLGTGLGFFIRKRRLSSR